MTKEFYLVEKAEPKGKKTEEYRGRDLEAALERIKSEGNYFLNIYSFDREEGRFQIKTKFYSDGKVRSINETRIGQRDLRILNDVQD